jgi:8-oxo-dGTP diphosphatase
MTTVAKVLIIDGNENYLLMTRSDHPTFGFDWDLPGGTLEFGEDPKTTAARELFEEIDLRVAADSLILLRHDTSFSRSGTAYYLYEYRTNERPNITMSWEHTSYKWIGSPELVKRSTSAVDTYMHMVGDTLATVSR